jgi:MoaA/NifB/PqqE/SkfB family radical SAM enzyme
MSDALYRRCIDEIASVEPNTEAWLADHGETLLIGRAIVDKVRYAKSKGLNKVFLNTNGMLLTPEISRGLVAEGLDGLFFGIDAVARETHARIRRGGDLEVILRNVDALLDAIARDGQKGPEVFVQFIEMDENEGEREAFIEYWKGKGVGVKVRRKLSWGGYIASPRVQNVPAERIPCPWIMSLMHVLWDGRVGRCTGDHECNYPMGNVLDSSIAAIWQGSLRVERKIHLDRQFDRLNDQCKKCLDWKVGAAERIKWE